ncbi:hypothetical protein HDV03_002130 [Kappamyces sp. JEL0829]|nr:hypothetical protein HDV03_002130 [Kappamyces sp. JEL0829]
MVLSGIGRTRLTTQDISSFYPVTSIWTIDLAYLLRHYQVEDFTFYTLHIGVNWRHSSIPFYKESLQKDVKRIHSLFARAREQNVRVVPVGLKPDDLKRFLLSNRYAVILLVDLNLLSCHLCKEKQRKDWWKGLCYPKPSQPAEPAAACAARASTPSPAYGGPAMPSPSLYGTLAQGPKPVPEASPPIAIASSVGSAHSSPSRPLAPRGPAGGLPHRHPSVSSMPSPTKPLSSQQVTSFSSSVSRRLSFGGLFPTSAPAAPSIPPASISPSSSFQSSSSTLPNATLQGNTQAATVQTPNPQLTASSPLLPSRSRNHSSSSSLMNQAHSSPAPTCLGLCTSYSQKGYQLVVSPPEFVGHYIVLIGYDRDTDMFFFRDPGSPSELCAISGDQLEKAYCCPETDRDLIVVRMM